VKLNRFFDISKSADTKLGGIMLTQTSDTRGALLATFHSFLDAKIIRMDEEYPSFQRT